MGKNKLRKFAEMENLSMVFQYPYGVLRDKGFAMRGHWHEEFFGNGNPITVELGCGKGEYAVGLARRFPERNFIGIDIKGARMWTGAKSAAAEGLRNVAFVRTSIELLEHFFAPGEVAEIWITFPDPQMQKCRKRLTSTRFLNLYRRILTVDGIVNLKTDSPFLYEYTRRLVELNGFEVIAMTDDLYGSGRADASTAIKTYYEQQWLSRGKKIKLLSFRLPAGGELFEPEADDIQKDDYRSQARRANMADPSLLS